MYNYFEQIEKNVIDLSNYSKEFFPYLSKTSIHSDVTTWAYGDYVERSCIDLSLGKKITASFDIVNKNKRNA